LYFLKEGGLTGHFYIWNKESI